MPQGSLYISILMILFDAIKNRIILNWPPYNVEVSPSLKASHQIANKRSFLHHPKTIILSQGQSHLIPSPTRIIKFQNAKMLPKPVCWQKNWQLKKRIENENTGWSYFWGRRRLPRRFCLLSMARSLFSCLRESNLNPTLPELQHVIFVIRSISTHLI